MSLVIYLGANSSSVLLRFAGTPVRFVVMTTLLHFTRSLHGNGNLDELVNNSSLAMVNSGKDTAMGIQLSVKDADVFAALAVALDVLDLAIRLNIKFDSKVEVGTGAIDLMALNLGARLECELNSLLTGNNAEVTFLTLESHFEE